ncbi:hypothetical protein HYDPIDRAFT_150016 [Hydnomerulius pinastri MD-312]|nr:hypothetical protein HYDPIDRAFT_150016 [Hydnomerulius pinastri MD-312]
MPSNILRRFSTHDNWTLQSPQPKEHPIFGRTILKALENAGTPISTSDTQGNLAVWGYIPIVVAKCGLFLKVNGLEEENVFSLNGSTKVMQELQAKFEKRPHYGRTIDWKRQLYSPHDVAMVFRRYLTQMPEPIIPYVMQHDFRDAIAKQPFVYDQVVSVYKRLIQRMPRPNQFLLLYVLDLLSGFARNSEKNLMTPAKLAAIFRPGLISHPTHGLSLREHSLNQQVLEFLISQQNWLLLDLPPPPSSLKELVATPKSRIRQPLRHYHEVPEAVTHREVSVETQVVETAETPGEETEEPSVEDTDGSQSGAAGNGDE